jgi:hypothetical protein
LRVYRIEHRDTGKGPWSLTGTVQLYDAVSGHDPLDKRPTGPQDEGGPFYERFKEEGGIFGFLSISQLLDWFPSPAGREAMKGQGYIVAVYRVPFVSVNKGRNSVVFPQDKAVRVTVLNLMTMEEESDASEKGQVEGNHRQEHQGNEEGGLSAEAGGRRIPQSGPQERR